MKLLAPAAAELPVGHAGLLQERPQPLLAHRRQAPVADLAQSRAELPAGETALTPLVRAIVDLLAVIRECQTPHPRSRQALSTDERAERELGLAFAAAADTRRRFPDHAVTQLSSVVRQRHLSVQESI